MDTIVPMWFSRNVRHDCDGGRRMRTRYLMTLLSAIWIPSFSSSPWMRGAPQVGFSRLIRRIRSRVSFATTGRPLLPEQILQVFVPDRNVLLTGSRWGVGRTRSSEDDPAGSGPAGCAEESTKETRYAEAGRGGTAADGAACAATAAATSHRGRQGGYTRSAGTCFEPQAKRGGAPENDCGSFAARVEGFWPDAGQLPSCEGSRHPDRARGLTAADGGRRTVAAEAAEDQRHSPVAAAAQLSRRTGSVGHQRTRLAGGAGRETVSNLDDRRCHEPVAGALCSQRLDRGEHAAAIDVPGKVRPASRVLHRQSELVSDRSQKRPQLQAGHVERAGAAASNTDWTCPSGASDRLDCGTQSTGKGTSRARFWHSPGSSGEGDASGQRQHVGGGQSVPRAGVSAVVEHAFDGRACQCRRCPPVTRPGTEFSVGAEPRRATTCSSGLHLQLSRPNVPDRIGLRSAWIARRDGTNRGSSGWFDGGALQRPMASGSAVSRPDQGRFWSEEKQRCKSKIKNLSSRAHQSLARKWQKLVSGWSQPERCGENQPHSNARSLRLTQLPFGEPGKCSPAVFAFYCPKPSLRYVHHSDACNEKPRLAPGGGADHRGATSVAPALGLRSGATPRGHVSPNIHPQFRRSKPDIHDKSCQGGKQRFPPCARKRSLPGLSSARACGLLPLGVVPALCRTRHPFVVSGLRLRPRAGLHQRLSLGSRPASKHFYRCLREDILPLHTPLM